MSSTDASQHDLSDIHLFDPQTLTDPWATYQRLRDDAPVFFDRDTQLHVVTRYDLIMEAIKAPDVFSSQWGEFWDSAQVQYLSSAPPAVQEELRGYRAQMLPHVDTLVTADPPLHGKYRSVVGKLFTAGNVRKMEPYVQQIIDDTVDGLLDAGEIEFMHDFAFPVPLRIIADRLGVPPEDREFFYDGATVAASNFRLIMPDYDEAIRRAKLSVELQEYLLALVDERRRNPKDDMCSILGAMRLEDEDRLLDPAELWSILEQFMIAGHDTAAATFGWGMYFMCREPALQDRIRGDRDNIRAFIEETLRVRAPSQGLPRVVTRDTTLGGYALKKGDMIMLRFGAGNMDERQFECPAHVDIERRNAGAHLAFGSGIHHCLGAPLARQELNLGFAALLDRMGNFRLAADRPVPKVEPSLTLHNLSTLWITFEPR